MLKPCRNAFCAAHSLPGPGLGTSAGRHVAVFGVLDHLAHDLGAFSIN